MSMIDPVVFFVRAVFAVRSAECPRLNPSESRRPILPHTYAIEDQLTFIVHASYYHTAVNSAIVHIDCATP